MTWQLVRHPSGRYTRYSNICENFTHPLLSEKDALHICKLFGKTSELAAYEIVEANNSPQRWEECIQKIEKIHGKEILRGMVEELLDEDQNTSFSI